MILCIFIFWPTLALCDSCALCVIHQCPKFNPVLMHIMYSPSRSEVHPCRCTCIIFHSSVSSDVHMYRCTRTIHQGQSYSYAGVHHVQSFKASAASCSPRHDQKNTCIIHHVHLCTSCTIHHGRKCTHAGVHRAPPIKVRNASV